MKNALKPLVHASVHVAFATAFVAAVITVYADQTNTNGSVADRNTSKQSLSRMIAKSPAAGGQRATLSGDRVLEEVGPHYKTWAIISTTYFSTEARASRAQDFSVPREV